MQFNMWRDYLGSSKLLEAMKKECVERAQLPQPKPVTQADVWHFPWLQCLEDQQNALPSTPRNIVSPKIRDPDVMQRAPLHAPLTQLDNWTFAIPNSCGLDGQKNARLNTPSPLKTQMDSKDFLYFPTRWSADKEMTSLHTSRSQMDALDFTSSQACGPEMQKRDPLGRPRIQVDNINTSHPPSWWSKFQEETLRFSPIPKVDITHFPPANSSLSVGEEAAPALEERAKRNTADSKATTSWWNNCSCRLLGHNAPVGASDEAPRHLWGSDSQERASLHRSRSEVGSLESASNLWGSDSQERASLHRSRSEVGSLESTSNLWGSDSQERASLHRSRSEVGSLESASNLWRVDNNTAQHTTSAKGGAFGFAPPHQWGFKGQQDDSLRPSRIEVSARDFSLPHPWWPVVQKGSQRRTPSPEMYASDVAAPHVKMPKDWEEVLLPASGTKRAATDSQLQHFSGLEQQKNFSQRISQDDFQASEVISPQADATKASIWCAFCKHNGESKRIYCSHSLKDSEGHVQCPVLRNYVCPQCQATGDDAHTRRFCPRTEKGYASVYQYPTRNASGKRNQKLLSLVPKN